MLELARKNVSGATFVKADALSYEYPKGLGVVFAMSSLLHANKDDFKKALAKIHAALKPGGILFIDQKGGDEYKEHMKEDEFGSRMFYNYNAKLAKELAGDGFEALYEREYVLDDKLWFVVALKKT
jgi:SAM-dependent methyltransferase